MKYIGNITSDPKQNIKLILDDGSRVDFTLEYRPMQEGWFYSFTWGTYSVNNKRLVTSPNMLRYFRNIFSFGFACITTDGAEPIYQDDFVNGRAQFYLLNAEDVLAAEVKILNFDERLA